MHCVISYDLADDRLRAKAAKILLKRGCKRVQRSVFVAPRLSRREWAALQSALTRLLARAGPGSGDSILMIPLPEATETGLVVLGHNNILPELAPPPLKIIL